MVDILTFDGFFGAKFDILKPRWLPTTSELIDSALPSRKHANRRSRHGGGRKPSEDCKPPCQRELTHHCLREAMNMIIAIIGTAATPLIMALQIRAFTGSREVKLSAAPTRVAAAIVT